MPSRRAASAPSTTVGRRSATPRRGTGRGELGADGVEHAAVGGDDDDPPVASSSMRSVRRTVASTPVTPGGDRDRPDARGDVARRLRQRRRLAEHRLARLHPQQVGAERVDAGEQVGAARRRDADHRHHRGDADGDAERGQQRAQPSGAQADGADAQVACGADRRGRSAVDAGSRIRCHAATPAVVDHTPSRSDTWRGARAAISRSWVISTMVRPVAFRSTSSADDRRAGGRVEVAGGFVGEHDRRLGDQRAGDADPLALAAGQRARAVVRRGRRGPTGVERRRGRGAAVRGGRRRRRADRSATFSRAVSPSTRWNCWNTNPIRRPRRADSWPSRSGRRRGRRCAPVPVGRPVQCADDVDQRRLARAGRPDDGHQLAAADREVDAVATPAPAVRRRSPWSPRPARRTAAPRSWHHHVSPSATSPSTST